ncbi:MAG: hypothetical protein U0441_34700 [Polyangiaceae bacterium]
MTMWRVAPAVLFGAALMGCGNGSSGSAPVGSGAPAAGNSGAPQAAAANGKTVHQKLTKDECTFEFDAPEALKPGKEDGMSIDANGASFEMMVYAGASLYGLDQLAGLTLMGTKDTVLVKETANNINLVVTRSEKPPSDPNKFIGGHGEEANPGDRQLGCSYLCWGPKEKEAETVAMCKSVRIQYKKAAEK